ncbi:PEP-CTERM sorting domain-containing protein [Paracraurococcus ruber]|uniref:Ice-binding protein C-terminal domain-containing protein n=1 Tax=Paracraurococcus ruber TaxID=77675 RepID=A0ABS1CV97_9PROT|nr:PEP-CTERM sorting domain-containing protein [Paracraurococcus ruber]MBK1658278.1 hypothetical protein [Paracraurococcus ruber]TDG31017.1 PEP-CTERM sorting domain-containing protein [Paracraurococcus ruber]
MKISQIAAAGALAVTLGTTAQASPIPITGTAAIAVVGVSVNTSLIDVGTTFTNTLFSVVGGATGDFIPAISALLTLNPVTATVNSAVSFTGSFGSFVGLVDSTSLSAQSTPTSRTVTVYALGNFTPAGVLGNYLGNAMSATFSFTQTGGGSTSVSGSFSAAAPPAPPPPVPVPEPMSLALFGLGLAGFGLMARRKA